MASIDSDGILNTVVTVGHGTPSGSAMFDDAMAALSNNVRGIRGNWHGESGTLKDNLDSFNAEFRSDLRRKRQRGIHLLARWQPSMVSPVSELKAPLVRWVSTLMQWWCLRDD